MARLISVSYPVMAGKCLTRVEVFEVERGSQRYRPLGLIRPPGHQRCSTSAALHVWLDITMCVLCPL